MSAISCITMTQVMTIAHRGGEAYAPENTLAAFNRTLQHGIGWAETDLRQCASGEIVLLHDEQVDRTTDGVGSIHDLTLEEVQRLDAGGWFSPEFVGERIPTLEMLLGRFGDRLVYLLEIKDPGRVEEALVAAVVRHQLRHRSIVIGMHAEALERVKSIDLELHVGFTAHEPTEENVNRALEMGAHHIGILPRHVTPELVADCRARGLAVRAIHVHDETDIRRVLEAGVVGLVHSDARVLRDVL